MHGFFGVQNTSYILKNKSSLLYLTDPLPTNISIRKIRYMLGFSFYQKKHLVCWVFPLSSKFVIRIYQNVSSIFFLVTLKSFLYKNLKIVLTTSLAPAQLCPFLKHILKGNTLKYQKKNSTSVCNKNILFVEFFSYMCSHSVFLYFKNILKINVGWCNLYKGSVFKTVLKL